MKLKVVQFDAFALTPYYNIALSQALANAGCEVRYVTSKYSYDVFPNSPSFTTDELYFSWQSVYCSQSLKKIYKLLSYAFGHQAFLKSLLIEQPDIVHFQWSRIPLFDLPLVENIKKLGIPVVHTIHDVEPLFSYTDVQRLASVYGAADKLIVHGQSNHLELLRKYPFVKETNVQIIPHIVPIHHFSGITRSEARTDLSIPQDAPIILFCGSIRRYKHLENLIEAYLLARKKRSDLWLIIAGLQMYKEISREIRRLQHQAAIHLKYIPIQMIERYHRAANIAVFPYSNISQSGALITAMSFGLPVIVTDIGAMPETICGNGWVVPANDSEALATALLKATEDLYRLEVMGQRSLDLIAERHSGEIIAEQTICLYDQVT